MDCPEQELFDKSEAPARANEVEDPVVIEVASSWMKKSCWFVGVTINGQDVELLVDSGAEVSILSEKIWSTFCENGSQLEPAQVYLRGAFGSLSCAKGQAELQMSIGNADTPHTFIVSCLQNLDGILGIDYLNQHCKLDLPNGIMELESGEKVQMYNHSTSYIPVRVAKTTSLPAQALAFIKCKSDISLHGTVVQIQEAQKIAAHDHLFLPHCVTQSDNRTVHIAVINASTKPVFLHRGIQLAYACTGITVLENDMCENINNIETESIEEDPEQTTLPSHLEDLLREARTHLSSEEASKVKSASSANAG